MKEQVEQISSERSKFEKVIRALICSGAVVFGHGCSQEPFQYLELNKKSDPSGVINYLWEKSLKGGETVEIYFSTYCTMDFRNCVSVGGRGSEVAIPSTTTSSVSSKLAEEVLADNLTFNTTKQTIKLTYHNHGYHVMVDPSGKGVVYSKTKNGESIIYLKPNNLVSGPSSIYDLLSPNFVSKVPIMGNENIGVLVEPGGIWIADTRKYFSETIFSRDAVLEGLRVRLVVESQYGTPDSLKSVTEEVKKHFLKKYEFRVEFISADQKENFNQILSEFILKR